jgi:hypothetical protein
MKYYTYAHYTEDTKELFYIGKGTGQDHKRAKCVWNRNPFWKNKVTKHGGFTYEILAYWDTEEEAFSHERLLISCFSNLTNLTTGGEGLSGHKQSAETKEKRAQAHRGRKNSQKTLERMSKAQKENETAKKTLEQEREKQKKKVLCIETNEVFNSLSEAGQKTKVPFQNISKSCLGQRAKAGGYTWKYIE